MRAVPGSKESSVTIASVNAPGTPTTADLVSEFGEEHRGTIAGTLRYLEDAAGPHHDTPRADVWEFIKAAIERKVAGV